MSWKSATVLAGALLSMASGVAICQPRDLSAEAAVAICLAGNTSEALGLAQPLGWTSTGKEDAIDSLLLFTYLALGADDPPKSDTELGALIQTTSLRRGQTQLAGEIDLLESSAHSSFSVFAGAELPVLPELIKKLGPPQVERRTKSIIYREWTQTDKLDVRLTDYSGYAGAVTYLQVDRDK